MTVNNISYNTAALRKLLQAAFDSEEFTHFCYDNFRPVHSRFTPGMSHLSKIQSLIEHCERQAEFDILLDLVKEANPVQYEILAPQLIDNPESPADDKPEFPIFGVPSHQNPNFTGRQKILTEIHDNLNPERKTVSIQAITGLGGVGKTQIAVEYAYHHAGDYDLIWWIRAEEESALTADYQDLANQLNLSVKTGAEQAAYVNVVRHWLENTTGKWLLIFDNAERPERMRELLPVKGQGQILITSRNPNWRHLANVSHLDPFSSDETRDFLFKRTGARDEAAAGRLAELMGGLPLALEHAGAYIEKRGMPLGDYATLYEEERQALLNRAEPSQDYPETVMTTWELAFQQVKQGSRAAAALLNLCTFLMPDDIPLSMLRDGVEHLPEELAGVVKNRLELEDAVAALYQYSLIERKGDSLAIHRLVQDVARDRLGDERTQKWVEISVNLLANLFPFDRYKIKTWFACASLLPQAFAVVAHAEKHQVALEAAATLWQKTGEYLRLQGDYSEAQISIEHALDIRQRILAEDDPATAESLDYLGELQQEQAHYAEARTYHEQALSIRQAKFGREHEATALSLNNLGALFMTQGEYEQARPYYEEALAIRKQVLGDNHPDTATSLNDLGGLFQAQGEYEQARPHYEEALTIYRKVLGDNHPYTATGLNNLGGLFEAQGEYEQARPYFEEALAICRQVLGDNHPNTASSLNSLGVLLLDQGEYEQARPYLEEALAIRRQVLGDNHPNTATSLSNLGQVLRTQGEHEQARLYFEESLAICKQVLGDNHPDTAQSLNNLGALLFSQGRYVDARPYLEQAVNIYESTLGKKHPKLVTILSNLGGTMIYLGQFVPARRYLKWAADICRETTEQYAECEKINEQIKLIPGGLIGRGKGKAKRQKKKRQKKRR